MPLPLAPIALGLAAAGLKMYGGHGDLLEFLQHPLDLLAGHSGAKSLEELGEHFRKWVAGNQPPENEDLERVITRSAMLADLFCLSEGLPRALGGDRLERMRERFGGLLRGPRRGFLSQADELRIRTAVEGIRKRLHVLEGGTLLPVGIDPTRLLRSSPDDDYAVSLATDALEAVEREYQRMPDAVRLVFQDRWFGYLCLVFHEEIKTNDRVYRIFTLMQAATGFLNLECVIRTESELTRVEGRQHHDETSRQLDDLRALIEPFRATSFAYGLPARGLIVGRDAEIDTAFREWMTDRSRPLLIWGPPGIGKSTLALALLHHPEVAQRFGARRFLIRCDGFTNVEALQTGMGLEWFGLTASPRIGGEVLGKLSEGPSAVVIDNFESLYRAAGEEGEDWLRRLVGAPDVWLIVGVQGHEAPGGIDWIRRLEPSRLTLEQARQLFRRVAGDQGEDSSRLDGLLHDLDGVPHAVELLARQAECDPDLSSLAERWTRQRTALLQRGIGTTRQTNIAISYEFAIASPLMIEAALRMLRILATLPRGLALEDVPMAMESLDGVAAQDAAATLRRCALAFVEADRLRMLAPLREHVLRAHPATTSELRAIRDRFLRMAQSGWQIGAAGGGEVLRTMTREHLNCTWAVEASLDVADPTAVPAACGLGNFSRFSGVSVPAIVERATRLAHETGDREGEVNCIHLLGDIIRERSEHADARQKYAEALAIYRELGDRRSEAICVKRLGDIARERGEHADAGQRYEEALPIFREVGARLGEAACIQGLGDIALDRSEYAEARQRHEEALPIFREVGGRMGEAGCIVSLGRIAFARSDYAGARRAYEKALAICQEVGSRGGEANCILRLGDVALARRDYADARQRFERALAIHREVGNSYSIARSLRRLARLEHEREKRCVLLREIVERWTEIDRQDLLEDLAREFPGDVSLEG